MLCVVCQLYVISSALAFQLARNMTLPRILPWMKYSQKAWDGERQAEPFPSPQAPTASQVTSLLNGPLDWGAIHLLHS